VIAPPWPAVRPRWSSAAFLVYAGTFVLLLASLGLVGSLALKAGGHRAAALTGWSALVLAIATALAELLRRRRRPVLAGLASFVAVLFAGVFVGALTAWIGIAPGLAAGFLPRGFEPGLYLTELALVSAGLAATRVFRFPLLVLPVAATLLYALVDGGTALLGGDSGSGVPALFAAIGGAALVAAGVSADRTGHEPYGFWLHVVGGVGVGEAILYLPRHGEAGWAAVAIGSLVYVGAARVLARSSSAVLGAIGVLIVSTHWIERWLSARAIVPFFGAPGGRPEPWEIALAYVGVGLVLVLLGVLVHVRRDDRLAPPPGTDSIA
jgi:hypothetical protein